MASLYEATLEGKEGQTAFLETTLIDFDGTAFEPSDINSIKATLVCLDDRDEYGDPEVINNRTQVEIKNANGGTFVTGGLLTWKLTPADMCIRSELRSIEKHLLILDIKYNANVDTAKLLFLILVNNVEMI